MGNPGVEGEYRDGRSLAFSDIKGMNSAWRSVVSLARQYRRAKGERVEQAEGELFFLDRGKLRLVFQGWEGTEKTLWYIREGCIFGETPYFDRLPNEGFFVCASDCVIYVFSEQTVEQIGRERPDLLRNLLQSMARKLRIQSYHVSSLFLDDALSRICKFLSQRLVPGSSPLAAKVGMSRQEMASLLGMHRISLYRTLRQQEARGLFGSIKGRYITILRSQEFYNLAGR